MTLRRALWAAIATLSLASTPAVAAERGFTVSEFDRIRVDGGFDVNVVTGSSPSVRAAGDAQTIERLSVVVLGRTLTVRQAARAWNGEPDPRTGRVVITVRVPVLIAAALNGSGSVRVSKMRGARIAASLAGPGSMTIDSIDTDRLTIGQIGSGSVTVSGAALLATVANEGSGTLDAAALSVGDLTVSHQGSGRTAAAARRSAKIFASGSGAVTVSGNPACTVNALGAGTVLCGKDRPQL